MPGPESWSSSDRVPPSEVVLKRVITSPALSPAFSAGPPGVTPSIRAPILPPAASARVSTTTPMRPRLPLKEYTPSGPVSTRTRGRARTRGCGASCVMDVAGQMRHAASAAIITLRIIASPKGSLEPDVTSPRRAGRHQLPHQPDPLLPKFYKFGVPLTHIALHQGGEAAIDNRNAIFELRHHGRAMTAEHASVDIVLLQGIFERSGLLFRLGQLGVQVAALAEDRPLNQQDTGEESCGGERSAPGAPAAPPPDPLRVHYRDVGGAAIPWRILRWQ